MVDGTIPPDPWDTLFQVLNQIPAPVNARPTFPEDIPVSLRVTLSQAYARGRQSCLRSDIDSPMIPENATNAQVACIFHYYGFGQDKALARLQPLAPNLPANTPATTSTVSSLETPAPRPRIPKVSDLEPFKGERTRFRNFATQLQLKFASDPSAFATDTARITYAGSYLRDAAYTWFTPYVSASTSWVNFDNYESFYQALKAAFDDPDSYATAERSLLALKQDKSCSTYYSRFLSLITTLSWKENAVKIYYFRLGLKENLKDLLVRRSMPLEFEKFAETCIALDNQLYARTIEKKTPVTRTPTSTPLFIPATPRSSSPAPTSIPQSKPMELDASARKAYRRANNLCAYCGNPNH
ncbi:hypothetical protein GTA08_BOTSDO10407 [Botryosphaeria dothidea]|uniref:Ty3 transposon capsid-like protein domain-containing protein n=1 Tax=Botryosphaeria dothidea TaxID=55169 RepID=A0A8H4IIH8_9PEZI|nr:hypothetical protein GTA08_BOTSDO10407 [Botryosphaeria dothidea]